MSARDEEDRWTRRGVVRAGVIALFCLGTGAGLGRCITHEPTAPEGATPPEPKPEPGGQLELAVVAPLRVGSELGGFEVREVRALHRGTISVLCAKGGAVVRLEIARAGGSASAPATAGPYAVFYSTGAGASSEDGAVLAQKLADVVGKNASALPAELEPFEPRAHELALALWRTGLLLP